MIRIKIELWPGGDRKRARTLGEMSIANNGTGSLTRGNYSVLLHRGQGGRLRRGEVRNFPRRSYSVFRLLRLALNDVFERGDLP